MFLLFNWRCLRCTGSRTSKSRLSRSFWCWKQQAVGRKRPSSLDNKPSPPRILPTWTLCRVSCHSTALTLEQPKSCKVLLFLAQCCILEQLHCRAVCVCARACVRVCVCLWVHALARWESLVQYALPRDFAKGNGIKVQYKYNTGTIQVFVMSPSGGGNGKRPCFSSCIDVSMYRSLYSKTRVAACAWSSRSKRRASCS